jgi:hypothetical protein
MAGATGASAAGVTAEAVGSGAWLGQIPFFRIFCYQCASMRIVSEGERYSFSKKETLSDEDKDSLLSDWHIDVQKRQEFRLRHSNNTLPINCAQAVTNAKTLLLNPWGNPGDTYFLQVFSVISEFAVHIAKSRCHAKRLHTHYAI